MSKTFFNPDLKFWIRISNPIFRRSCWICIILNFTFPALAQNDRAKLDNTTFPDKFRIEVVANNLRVPWSIAFTPDGRIFFTECIGQVRVIENGHLIEEPILKLEVSQGVKMGLLGMALDPEFTETHYVYLAYNYAVEDEFRLRIVRYREITGRLVEPFTLIEDIPAARNHTGCRLRFGPDGKLYITTGDADRPRMSQRLDFLSGKILRLNPDGSIPDDNPYVNNSNAHPAIWSYGHRNPQGLDFQPVSGQLFASEHGPNGSDEINIISPEYNYGWPDISHQESGEGMESPLLEFTPAIGPGTALFYTVEAFPSLNGDLLVGLMRAEGILRIRLNGKEVVEYERWFHRAFGRIREIAMSPEGLLYFTTTQYDPPEGNPRRNYDMILRTVPNDFPFSEYPIANLEASEALETTEFDPRTLSASPLIGMYCSSCHGPNLTGGLHSNLTDNVWSNTDDDQIMLRIILEGLEDEGMPHLTACSLLNRQIRFSIICETACRTSKTRENFRDHRARLPAGATRGSFSSRMAA